MASSARVSVIMLTYNTSRELLDKSIKSVLNQTYKNVELIIVNDKSTSQETIKTIKAYEKKYSNIHIAEHEVNHGMLRGRITGFRRSTGDYVTYLDSDDAMSLDYLRTMVETAEKNKADLVVSTFSHEDENGNKSYFARCPFRNKTYDLRNEEIFDAYMGQQGHCYSWSLVWNKLYSRELAKNTVEEFEEFSMAHNGLNMTEDIAFSSCAFIRAKHMVSCTGEGVYYYQHSAQSTKVHNNENKYFNAVNDISSVFSHVIDLMKRHNVYEKHEKNFEKWREHYAHLYTFFKPPKRTEKEIEKHLKKKFMLKTICKPDGIQDDYYYNQKNWLTWDEGEKEKIVKEISSPKTKVVSFDVFETLINRQVFEPTDIFTFLNIEYQKLTKNVAIDFYEIRKMAERNTRKESKHDEITFDEIYKYIEKNYFIDHQTCEFLKRKEIELEIKFMIPRQFGKKLFDIARYCGKEVVFTSDMYLSKSQIKKLLTSCGYPSDVKIFVSSENRITKGSGKLFNHVLKELNVKPNEMVHIGDNFNSDYKVPKSMKIKAFYVPNTKTKFYDTIFHRLFLENNQYINVYGMFERVMMRNMFALVQNKLFDNPYIGFDGDSVYNGMPKYLGYFAVGMELVSLMHWLEEKVKNSSKIHFVARDGYLPMLAYQELKKYNLNLPDENYFYVSRKSLLLLDVKNVEDLAGLTVKTVINKLSPKKLLSYFNEEFVNEEKLKEKCLKKKIGYDKKFEDVEEFYKAVKLFDSDVVDYKKHRKYCEKIIENFSKIITKNNKFFDIGYSGRAESIISKVLGYPVDSLYIHTNGDVPAIRSQINNFKIDCFMQYPPKVTGTIREHIFMKSHPSLVKYELKNGELEYVFEEDNTTAASKIITEIVQNEAIEYVKDFYKFFYEYLPYCSFQEGYAIFPFEKYLNEPAWKDKSIFSCVKFEDELGYGGNKNMMELWDSGNWIARQPNLPSADFAYKLVGKLNHMFPVGTKRRAFAKKVYHSMLKVKRAFKRKK